MSYVGLFAIGNTLGAMSMPPAAGAIFDQYPFGVVSLCFLHYFGKVVGLFWVEKKI